MPKVNVYTVYDEKAEQFGPLFEAVNDEVATRSFLQMMDKVHPSAKNDYILEKVGEFDTNSGDMQAEVPQEVFRNIRIKEVV